jgi:hypothetical protein
MTAGEVRSLNPLVEAEHAIIQSLEAQRGAHIRERPQHVPVINILLVLWKRYGMKREDLPGEDDNWRHTSGFSGWLEELNGFSVAESNLLNLFRPHWDPVNEDRLKEEIKSIRGELLKTPDMWKLRPGEGTGVDAGDED